MFLCQNVQECVLRMYFRQIKFRLIKGKMPAVGDTTKLTMTDPLQFIRVYYSTG